MRRRIESVFWNETLGLHVVAVDGANRQLDVATSNPAHLLWAGALKPVRAKRVAGGLFEDDLWSGWGLRTLSERAPRYQLVLSQRLGLAARHGHLRRGAAAVRHDGRGSGACSTRCAT